MACEKKSVSSFTVRVGLVLLAGCILVPMSLVTMFRHYTVPMQTLSLLFSVDSSVTLEDRRIGSHRSGRSDGPVLCDFSSPRSDVCELKGDVRVLPNATIVHLHPSARPRSWRMKPLARKADRHALARVTEVLIASSHSPINHSASASAPPCTARHAAPAVVFSAGGYAGNMFHDLTDVLVPLFVTARRYGGDVHLLVTDAQPWWFDRYGPLLRGLSRHDVVDMDRAGGGVLCYPHVTVGLEFHKEMSVDAARTPAGTPWPTSPASSGDPTACRETPRPSVSATAATITRTATAAGFDTAVAEPEQHADLGAFAREVNSRDVLVGVHGAGLANLVFLPAGGVVVQVVPLGGLDAMAAEDFGAPARDAGLGYVHYGVAVEESSLARRYPRDHRVLRDPDAVRREGGWMALRDAYLVGQNVTVDVARFRGALRRAMELLQ
ncbi:hypothetical protein EJB05_31871 [Eragrostis curvula]|uniref:Glycosyltransferase family 61 protein n=1 Tax=Eragrostis curvula TaxID=38414 RepID=A0A5J9UEL7_9POAL|nr:hypothetical protein EJB05_31871 [Eragrostis curvula]